MGRSSAQSHTRLAIFLIAAALFLLLLGLPSTSEQTPEEGGTRSQSSVAPGGEVDLLEVQLQLEQEKHRLSLDFERLTSGNPSVGPVWQPSLDHGVELEGETYSYRDLDPSEAPSAFSPKHETLRELKEAQDREQWRLHRDEAFVREVLRRAREDGWHIQLDEDLKVRGVQRIQPGPYRDSSGSMAQ